MHMKRAHEEVIYLHDIRPIKYPKILEAQLVFILFSGSEPKKRSKGWLRINLKAPFDLADGSHSTSKWTHSHMPSWFSLVSPRQLALAK